MIAGLWRFFTCRHRSVLFDRVRGVAVWRCEKCMKVRER